MLNNRIDTKKYCKCPKCGSDAEVDTSVVLTSYPPKYRAVCPNCGEVCNPYTYETYYKWGEVFMTTPAQTNIVKSCMICGETVRELDPELMEYSEYYGHPEICDKCKQVIMAMRKQLEKENG